MLPYYMYDFVLIYFGQKISKKKNGANEIK